MTKPREKTHEELTAEIEDGKKKIRQFENREKIIKQKLSVEERKARNHRLCKRGGFMESLVPELKIQVRFLLGARLKIYPFSVESGFFSYTFSSVFAKAKNAKKAKKCIFLVDPVWCTANATILHFSRRQNLNYTLFFCKLYPHNLNSRKFLSYYNY